jgi:lysophospholipase L1-like esterase
MLIPPNAKLVMIGDSITDCERARPVGEGLFGAIGKGYVALVEGLLFAAYPERRIRVVNMGTSGNTVLDLQQRWQTDVLDLTPDWLSIMIGINDVWRQFDMPRQTEVHVLPDRYESTYDALITQSKKNIPNIILLTPFFIEDQRGDAMRKQMDAYGTIVKKLGAKHGLTVVDTQAAFDAVLQYTHSSELGWDRVHPSLVGHMILARAFTKAIGFDR